jgi:hypothetical protein
MEGSVRMIHIRIALAPLLICTAFSAAGCGPGVPSDKQARQVVDGSFKSITNDVVKVVDFRKTNGEMKIKDGQKTYEYHFLAAAELPAGFAWVLDDCKGYNPSSGYWVDVTPCYIKSPPGNPRGFHTPSGLILDISALPEGTTAVESGTIAFRYTENGWVTPGVRGSSTFNHCANLKPNECYEKLGWDKLN